jgi:hypothetical protein
MARTYRRDKNGRFSGGGGRASIAPRTMRTSLARTTAPQGTISKKKSSREANRDSYKGKEEIGNVGRWILRERPRRLPGGPLLPAKLRKYADDSVSAVKSAGMRRRSARTRRAT